MCRWDRHLQGAWRGGNSPRPAIFISAIHILHHDAKSRKGFLFLRGINYPKRKPPETEIGSVSCRICSYMILVPPAGGEPARARFEGRTRRKMKSACCGNCRVRFYPAPGFSGTLFEREKAIIWICSIVPFLKRKTFYYNHRSYFVHSFLFLELFL